MLAFRYQRSIHVMSNAIFVILNALAQIFTFWVKSLGPYKWRLAYVDTWARLFLTTALTSPSRLASSVLLSIPTRVADQSSSSALPENAVLPLSQPQASPVPQAGVSRHPLARLECVLTSGRCTRALRSVTVRDSHHSPYQCDIEAAAR